MASRLSAPPGQGRSQAVSDGARCSRRTLQLDMGSETNWSAIAKDYEAGRPSPDEGFAGWRSHLQSVITPGERVVDVGAGTGQWATAISRWFEAMVVGVEPSAAMIRAGSPTGGVSFVQGRAEALPLATGRFGYVWMSTVLGQLQIATAVPEISRVLVEDGGVVLIREGFADRPWNPLIERYFPSILDLAAQRGVLLERIANEFESRGFELQLVQPVEEMWAESLAEALERVRHRAGSLLAAMDDAEWAAGLDAMESDVRGAEASAPVVSQHDLVVFSRSARKRG